MKPVSSRPPRPVSAPAQADTSVATRPTETPLATDRTGPRPHGLAAVTAAIVSCDRCPRLRQYCADVGREKKRAHAAEVYWARPVPGFGDPAARILLIGLAPAAHGANRTGRVFTGDGVGGSSDFLMAALHRAGLANLPTSHTADDGLRLTDTYITSALRCAPPDNTPTPDELSRCLPHLSSEVEALAQVRVVVALGKIAFDAWLRMLKQRGVVISPRPPFAHGEVTRPGPDQPAVIGCYHPSRQNTNTGRLTPAMADDVFRTAKRLLARD